MSENETTRLTLLKAERQIWNLYFYKLLQDLFECLFGMLKSETSEGNKQNKKSRKIQVEIENLVLISLFYFF